MMIDKVIGRKSLQDLLMFIESGENRVNGEEFNHPSPRSIGYLYKIAKGGFENGDRCCRLFSVVAEGTTTHDRGGVNRIHVNIWVADKIEIYRGGLAREQTSRDYPIPERILGFLSALE